jgi:hypothetical protein
MRWTLALVALTVVACRTRVQTEIDDFDLYGGGGLSALPNIGGSVTAGQYMAKRSPKFDYAFEMRLAYQGGDDSPTQDGEFVHMQAGAKQIASPGHTRRPFFRYGFTWFRANGNPDLIDIPGDYLGVYGGFGYEWDLSRHWTFSPDFSVNLVNGEGSTDSEVLPQLNLNFLFRF